MERFTVLIFLFVLIAVTELSRSLSHDTTLPLKLSTHPKKKTKRTKGSVQYYPISSQRMNVFYRATLN